MIVIKVNGKKNPNLASHSLFNFCSDLIILALQNELISVETIHRNLTLLWRRAFLEQVVFIIFDNVLYSVKHFCVHTHPSHSLKLVHVFTLWTLGVHIKFIPKEKRPS